MQRLFIIVAILLGAFGFAGFYWNQKTVAGPFIWEESGTWKEQDAGSWTYKAQDWEVEIIGPASASIEKFDNFLRAKLDTYFRVMFVPYTGFISQKTECENKYKPQEVSVESSSVRFVGFRLFAGERRQMGTCTPESITFRSYVGRLHCLKKKTYYELRFFERVSRSEEAFKDLLAKVTCP